MQAIQELSDHIYMQRVFSDLLPNLRFFLITKVVKDSAVQSLSYYDAEVKETEQLFSIDTNLVLSNISERLNHKDIVDTFAANGIQGVS